MPRILMTVLAATLMACSAPQATVPTGAAPRVVPTDAFTTQLNGLRQSNGLGLVVPSPQLAQAATAHARDMSQRGYFAHRAPDGSRADRRIAQTGYSACGWAENLGSALPNRSAAFAAWQGSPLHLKNMLGANYTEYGLGEAGGNWVLLMARPC